MAERKGDFMSKEEYTEYLVKRLKQLEKISDSYGNCDLNSRLDISAQADYIMKELYLISKAI